MKHSDISIRIATREDVGPLLNLLPQITSRPQSFPGKTLGLEDSIRIFDEMSACGNVHVLVGELGDELIAALTIAIIPNFTYEGRPWSIIENVVVPRERRGRGVGKKLMAFALGLAQERGCYKVQLLSGLNDGQIGFYRSAGLNDESRF